MNIAKETISVPVLDEELFTISTLTLWFIDMANYLVTWKFPQNISTREKHNIFQWSANYSWIDGNLFCIGPDLIMRRCVQEDEMFNALKACHTKPCGGNFTYKRTTHKVLHTWYYWPMLFIDAKKFCFKMWRLSVDGEANSCRWDASLNIDINITLGEMGIRFFGTHISHVQEEEIHFDLHWLCDEMGGGQGFVFLFRESSGGFPFWRHIHLIWGA